MSDLVPVEIIANKIFLIRGQKVMLDRDLAKLYGVPTKVFNQAVKRNIRRFPEDFMFQLNKEEFENWRSQIVTSNISAKMGLRRCPYAFTDNGIAMLSSVLNSERAIMVNISIMRVFSKLKQLALSHSELLRKVESLERKYGEHDKKIAVIFQALKQLLEPSPPKKTGKIGF
ncbi:MAG: ORF6N domain-containing protein [bacterium]